MKKIDNIRFTANVTPVSKETANISAENKSKEIKELSNSTADFNVKIPMSYTATGETKLPNNLTAHSYKLANGQKVIIVPKKGSTIIKTYVNTGSMNEPDEKRGISHYIEHNLFNGSEGLDEGEFFAKTDKMGATVNASTGFAQTDYYIKSQLLKDDDLENQIKMHASMIETPRFAVNMLEKEKGPVTSEIHMISDNPINIANNLTVKNLLNIKSTSEDILGGTVDNINKMTREDVVDYYNKNYHPQNRITVITGEVEPEKAMELISKNFTTKASPIPDRNYEKFTPIEKSVRKDLISDKTNSTIGSIGFVAPKNNDSDDLILFNLLINYLAMSNNSKLNKNLDKLNASTNVSFEKISTKPDENRIFLLNFSSSEENSENVLKTIYETINDLKTNPPTEKELNALKQMSKVSMASSFENSENLNNLVAEATSIGDLDFINKNIERLETVTPQDLVKTAEKYLNLNKASITIVHPKTTDADLIKENYKKTNKISFTGKMAEKTAIENDKINIYEASNKMHILTNKTDSDVVNMQINLKTELPPAIKPATKEILAGMLQYGTANKSQEKFYKDLEENGIFMAIDSSSSKISVSSDFLPENTAKAMAAAKENILNPRLTQENFDFVKSKIKENLLISEKYASDKVLEELLNDGIHISSKEDMLKNIDDITLNDVIGLHQYIIQNSMGNIAVSGDFDKNKDLKETVFKEASSGFGQLKPNKIAISNYYTPVIEPKIITDTKENNQAEIVKAYKFKYSDNLEDKTKMILLNQILGGGSSSRLFNDLREKQKLAYAVGSDFAKFDDTGVINLHILTTTDNKNLGEFTPENVQKSLDGFSKHVDLIKKEIVSDKELEAAKLALKTHILNSVEENSNKNSVLLSSKTTPYGVDELNLALKIIDKITPEDIKNTANYVFSTNPITVVYASENTLNANKNYLSEYK